LDQGSSGGYITEEPTFVDPTPEPDAFQVQMVPSVDGAFDASNDFNANNAYETDDNSSTTNDVSGPTNIVEEQKSPEDSSQETYNENYEANDTPADTIGNSESALMDASLGGGDNEGHLGADQLLDNSIDTAVTEAMDSVIEQGANPEAPEDEGYGTVEEEVEVEVWDSSDLDMSGVS
jgi:hypothetical protein